MRVVVVVVVMVGGRGGTYLYTGGSEKEVQ
jgi:hypothetical protein